MRSTRFNRVLDAFLAREVAGANLIAYSDTARSNRLGVRALTCAMPLVPLPVRDLTDRFASSRRSGAGRLGRSASPPEDMEFINNKGQHCRFVPPSYVKLACEEKFEQPHEEK